MKSELKKVDKRNFLLNYSSYESSLQLFILLFIHIFSLVNFVLSNLFICLQYDNKRGSLLVFHFFTIRYAQLFGFLCRFQ